MQRASRFLASILLAALPLLSSAAGFADCPQFFPSGRAPAVPAQPMQRELCFSEFAVLHSGQTKTPIYVAQRLNAQMLQDGRELKRHDRFYAEARLPRAERAELEDYKRSGYSRGHMAPAGDLSTPDGKAQSFSLANMAPQDPKHNGGAWTRIEKDTRRYIERARGDVFVITGPLFEGMQEAIGPNRVGVPSHFFKLVYDASTGRSWVHVQRNAADERAGPPISYEEFVRRTGFRLLP
jgi:endonuclease G